MPSIEFEIDNEDWLVFVQHFCTTHPNQTKENDNPLTDEEWVKHRIMLFARGAYIKGLREAYARLNGPDINYNIITLNQ